MRRFYIPGMGGAVSGEYIVEDGVVHRRIHQASRDTIMRRNQELRKTPGAVKTTSFGKLELDIPIVDLKMLDRFFPGIAQPGHPDHKWQMRRFMKSPASAPYRIVEQKKGVNRRV